MNVAAPSFYPGAPMPGYAGANMNMPQAGYNSYVAYYPQANPNQVYYDYTGGTGYYTPVMTTGAPGAAAPVAAAAGQPQMYYYPGGYVAPAMYNANPSGNNAMNQPNAGYNA